MGCFSGTVSRVANTRLFARVTPDATQFLVVQLEYTAPNDFALIVPLPTPLDANADAVRFLRFSNYAEFFSDLENGFPLTRNAPASGNQAQRVVTNLVGSFDASFVPSQQALAHLDERFRIPAEIWKQLPEYSEFGFAVFKLRAGTNTVQPLAFEFPTRNPQLLYFPTMHIQNGKAPEEANFDHDLFCQARAGWLRSYDVAGSFMDVERAQGVIAPNERVSRMTVQGRHPNSDILVGLRA